MALSLADSAGRGHQPRPIPPLRLSLPLPTLLPTRATLVAETQPGRRQAQSPSPARCPNAAIATSISKADRPATGASDERRRVARDAAKILGVRARFRLTDFWRSVRAERGGDEEMARRDATTRSMARSR